ncbi:MULTISPECIES: YihY/virulence factor BrkB family protein [unclassified Frondihabitans]|uniref:YihY/virulence factor BrkB family protein n=1 Tax=unclassified Frondihabitans TaxID=2626248 RepID=UPI000FB53021|nr:MULTISPECIES: YihY/virulence factor BrkB family protein [unclassified Frondihabitans]RPE78158.1 membrane protein [Frondihabitans sp. PhB153]RPF08439.1 membrane protein [Frondihabitans sp. PhB161]
MAQSSSSLQDTPPVEDDAKPDTLPEITKRTWVYTFKKTLREFTRDQCTDLAAALTYFAVQALFPALLAIVSILGLFGQGKSTTEKVLDLITQLGGSNVVETIRGPVEALADSDAAGITFVVGLIGAIWSASGYVGAFGRALNRIYSRDEGRPIWKLRPTNLLVTIVAVVLIVVAGLILVLSGDIARTVGDFIGLGDATVTVWLIVKWPLLAVIVVVVVAVLYYFAPNVKQPKFRWMSMGAFLAIFIWALASVGFAFYVANFSSYNKTYGALGGVIVFLLWLWITNIALLLGAEFDAEVERGRELQAGIKAEEEIQLPPRDTRQIEKMEEKRAKDVEEAVEVREAAEEWRDQEEAAGDDEERKPKNPVDNPADFV